MTLKTGIYLHYSSTHLVMEPVALNKNIEHSVKNTSAQIYNSVPKHAFKIVRKFNFKFPHSNLNRESMNSKIHNSRITGKTYFTITKCYELSCT